MPNQKTLQKIRKQSSNKTSIPRNLVPKDRVIDIVRVVETQLSVYDGTSGSFGWTGVGQNALAFFFSLQSLYYSIGGAAAITVAVPGASDISNLFEEYCIKNVELIAFYGNNTSSNTSSGNLPTLAIVEDYTASNNVLTMSQALQYSNLKLRQLGNVRGQDSSIRLRMKPVVSMDMNSFGTPTPGNTPVGDVWIQTSASPIVHNSIQMVLDTSPAASAALMGYVSFYFKITYGCRHPI